MDSANVFESAANSLQTGARRIKNIADAIYDQFYRSDQIARSLPDFWQGKSADAFITAWISCYQNAQKSTSHLDVASSCCNQIAQAIEENLPAIRNWESMQWLQSEMQRHSSSAGAAEFQQASQQAVNAQAAITMMVSSLSSQLEQEADQIEMCPQEKSVSPFDPWNGGPLYYNDGEPPLTSPELVEEQIQAEESAIEAQVVEDELLLLEEEGKDDSEALYARSNKRVFKNPINMDMESTDENMPPGVKNPIGKKLIDMIRKLGIRVEWNRSMQVELANASTNGAYGATFNLNGADPANANKNFVVVGLSPDATNAVVYEEF
ncbi:MAG: WXG100 family type VII secretion target, partial [Ktedonobacteraceae bacterium]|nr:WXG100 family type VII secretion target [Ktedonobacteraceae bacterium]